VAKFKKNLPAFLSMAFVLLAFLWASGEDYKLGKAEDLSFWCEMVESQVWYSSRDEYVERCVE